MDDKRGREFMSDVLAAAQYPPVNQYSTFSDILLLQYFSGASLGKSV